MKKTKTLIALLLVLVLFSSTAFARGAKEIQENEKLIKVISVTEDNGHYDIHGLLEDGTDIIYHTSDETKSAFPISSFKEGTILAVKDSGTMTMSLPPQSTAVEIRDVTFAVNNGIYAVSFPEPEPVVVAEEIPVINIAEINFDDILSAFNYSYGYLVMQNIAMNGITLDGGYFAKGVYDMSNWETVEALFDETTMNNSLDQYVIEFMQANEVIDKGVAPTSLEDIEALPVPETLADIFSYSYGYLTTYDLLYAGYDIHGPEYLQGCLEFLYGVTPMINQIEMEENINAYIEYVNTLYEQYYGEISAENLAAAEAFLAENALVEGVVTLDSGVQILYRSEADPSAEKPLATDTINCDYRLSLLDGTVADQATSIEFPLTSLIPGFVEAATLMSVGQSITCYIPPALGYGTETYGPIPPNSLLIFDITLNSIVK